MSLSKSYFSNYSPNQPWEEYKDKTDDGDEDGINIVVKKGNQLQHPYYPNLSPTQFNHTHSPPIYGNKRYVPTAHEQYYNNRHKSIMDYDFRDDFLKEYSYPVTQTPIKEPVYVEPTFTHKRILKTKLNEKFLSQQQKLVSHANKVCESSEKVDEKELDVLLQETKEIFLSRNAEIESAHDSVWLEDVTQFMEDLKKYREVTTRVRHECGITNVSKIDIVEL